MQSKRQSVVEVVAGTAIGFVIAMAAQVSVAWYLGLGTTLGQDLGITAFFTCISVARGYAVRRLFNRLAMRADV